VSAGGVLLIVAGVWLGCQVFGGNLLGRLNISGAPSLVGGKGSGQGGT
jgi:hypothetical protein